MKRFLLLVAVFLLVSCAPNNEYGGYKYEQQIVCFSGSGEIVFEAQYVRVIPMGYNGGTWRVSYPNSDEEYEFPMDSCEVNHMEELSGWK